MSSTLMSLFVTLHDKVTVSDSKAGHFMNHNVVSPRETPETTVDRQVWHALSREAVFSHLETGEAGLTTRSVQERLATHGENRLPEPPRPHPLMRFLSQFNNTLIYFLISASVASAVLGHVVDAVVILGVVVVNAVVGFVQEGKAEKALDAIRDMISPHAHVVRDGERQIIDARHVVPGDLVVVEAGDKVPADLRLVRASSLLADEAILTGESVPAEKHTGTVAPEAPVAERASMLFSGTILAAGQGTGVVVETGARTEIGRISALIGTVQQLTTPLLTQIDRFGRLITWFALSAAVALFFFAHFIRDYHWVDALMVVVALAVGVVPEGLPAVITITLAIGVRRMAARNAVVRRLPAVETLGSTSVICSDKTGTLTKNEMTVGRIATATAMASVSGAGYAPAGKVEGPEDPVRDRLVLAGLLCGDAHLKREDDGHYAVFGDPMEGALVTLALKAGLDPAGIRENWPRLADIPFDAAHRFMATLHAGPDGGRIVFLKGAPERLLAMCDRQKTAAGDAPVDPVYWDERIEEAAESGERVLGFAELVLPPGTDSLSMDMLAHGLVFLGVAGFIDPPRPEAMKAVAECRSAGIAVKMITGDHGATAAAIARTLGIAENPVVVTGVEVDGLSDAELEAVALKTSVFARTSPEHKLRIVRALQANGLVVAMTGDGVNDAPSLKQADVGIAMGRKGTEAAKQAAEMVLVDDNFASIVAAVHEGRTVYDNIRKVIGWTLPTNGGEFLAVVFAILFGLALPMTPVQILWVNMIITVTLGLVLAFEPPEPGVMARRPRRRDASLVTPFLLWRIVFVSFLFMLGVFGVYFYALGNGDSEAVARTLVVNAIAAMEIFYLFNVRYLHMTSFTLTGLKGTRAVLLAVGGLVVAQFGFTYLPFMNDLFGSAPVSFTDGVVTVAVGVAMLAVLEVEKWLIRRLGWFADEV